MPIGICLWSIGGIRMARIPAIRTQGTTRMAVCPYHHCHVVPMASGHRAAKHIAFSRTSVFRNMGNRKNRNRHPFASFVLGISWHRELLEERATFRYHIPCCCHLHNHLLDCNMVFCQIAQKEECKQRPTRCRILICFFLVENISIRPMAVWRFFVLKKRFAT